MGATFATLMTLPMVLNLILLSILYSVQLPAITAVLTVPAHHSVAPENDYLRDGDADRFRLGDVEVGVLSRGPREVGARDHGNYRGLRGS